MSRQKLSVPAVSNVRRMARETGGAVAEHKTTRIKIKYTNKLPGDVRTILEDWKWPWHKVGYNMFTANFQGITHTADISLTETGCEVDISRRL